MSSFNIDAYFFGSLKFQDFKIFKEFAEKICKEEKLKIFILILKSDLFFLIFYFS